MCGHVITLRHVRSGRLVSLAERALAPLDASCHLVQLVDSGSVHCWLQVEPTSLDQELLPLQPGAPISLVSPTSGQRLRFSPSRLPEPSTTAFVGSASSMPRHEVNSSKTQGIAPWRLVRQRGHEYSREHQTGLSRALPVGVSFCLLDSSRAHGLGVREEYLRGDGDSDGAAVEMLPLGFYHRSAATAGAAAGKMATAALEDAHAGSVWQLRAAGASVGEAVSLGMRCRLYHVATRKYLRAVPPEAKRVYATDATDAAAAGAAQ